MPKTHVPVLAGELIEALDPQPGQIAVDCTLGAGGHARLVAGRLGPAGLLVGIDRDPLAEEAFAELAAEAPCRTRFVRADFAAGLEALLQEGLRADMVYLDLGMSSMQVDTRERGFSYAYDAPLDMRMDPAQEVTAADVVNTWEPRRLGRLLRDYGEERYADRIAKEIARRRRGGDLTTTFELVDAITAAIPAPARFAGGHPAKRTFQAIRIAVNDELSQLDEALPRAWDLLRTGGRLAAISFHSLEDRRVKRFLADRTRGCICPPDLPVLRLRPDAAGRARLPPLGRADARRGRRQRALEVGAPARRPQAHATSRCAHDARRRPRTQPRRTPARRSRRARPRRVSGPVARRAVAVPGGAAALPRGAHRHDRPVRARPRAARAPDRRPPAAQPPVDLGARRAAGRDRDDAGLAAEAQLRHLARGRDDHDARAPERRAGGVDRAALLARPDRDRRGDARDADAARRRRRLPARAGPRTPARPLRRMQPPSDEAAALLANGGIVPGSLAPEEVAPRARRCARRSRRSRDRRARS